MGRQITFELLARSTKQHMRRDEEQKEFLRRLTHLTLQDKSIDSLTGIEDVVNLQTLYAYDNVITSINLSPNNRLITHLYLQNNRISVMENLSHLTQLQKLHIGGNMLSVVDGLEACHMIEELSIEKQRSQVPLHFHPDTLAALSRSLQTLICSHNRLGYDPQACLAPLSQLQVSEPPKKWWNTLAWTPTSWHCLRTEWRLCCCGAS
jgi:Leucine-rich repeat (LRR) protein